MPVFDENETPINDLEGRSGFTKVRSEQTGAWSIEKSPSFFKKIPVIPIILAILVVLVGTGVYFLGARLLDLKSEISRLKGAGDRIADLQSGVNARFGAVSKEQHKLQSEVAHLRGEIEAMKSRQKRQAEAAAQKQAAEAKKKTEKAEKTAHAKKSNPKERRL